jgi:RNase P subunit RPR2
MDKCSKCGKTLWPFSTRCYSEDKEKKEEVIVCKECFEKENFKKSNKKKVKDVNTGHIF